MIAPRVYKTAIVAFGFGMLVPAGWRAVYWALETWWPRTLDALTLDFRVDRILLVLCPSHLLLLGDPSGSNLTLFLISVVANGLLYALVGVCLYLAYSSGSKFGIAAVGFFLFWIWRYVLMI
jgi:hypothetical protein